ncbi:hypothetical protein EXIGLDRAFT_570594, partial [Exidia glandulosa HHB12029]
CDCTGATLQLLSMGYFPCAPLSPSMAFSFDLLQLISIHSLNVAPNASAWSNTLEAFWGRHGTPSRLKGRLRKRLGTVLMWFQYL